MVDDFLGTGASAYYAAHLSYFCFYVGIGVDICNRKNILFVDSGLDHFCNRYVKKLGIYHPGHRTAGKAGHKNSFVRREDLDTLPHKSYTAKNDGLLGGLHTFSCKFQTIAGDISRIKHLVSLVIVSGDKDV